MKISLNEIKTYTPVNISVEDLVAKLRTTVGEVEAYENIGEKYKGILIAQISEAKIHPDADKLGVYQIDIGKAEKVQIVAGDKTLKVGDKVAYMPPGTPIPNNANPEKHGNIVEKVKLKGIESNGMVASARELSLNNDHTIVMRLETEAKPGTTLIEALGLDDTIIEVENKALTNRPDLFGLIGMAREIAGVLGNKFTTPKDWNYKTSKDKDSLETETTLLIICTNNAQAYVQRYMLVSMKNIEVKQSPLWLQVSLVKSGIRPINNVVDITNYLMVLSGQPLHAFDYDKVLKKDKKAKNRVAINVRLAKNGEKLTLIDGRTIELHDKVVAICDSENPIAVGGEMGGLETEIDENTKNIIIECAHFDMYNIRKTSMSLGIFSEAVTRFSKNQDPNQCEPVLIQAIKMLEDLASGKLASDIVDLYPQKRDEKSIRVSLSRLNDHIGNVFTKEQAKSILENVELEVKEDPSDKDYFTVQIPTHRQDLSIPEDIHEEVARLYGYNNVELTLPTKDIMPVSKNKIVRVKERIRNRLTSLGAQEILTYNFTSAELIKSAGLDLSAAYHLTNALSPELEYMKTAMTPSILQKIPLNIRNGYDSFALYEINVSHIKDILNEEDLPHEQQNLSLVLSMDNKVSSSKNLGSPYYQAKKYLEELLVSINPPSIQYESLDSVDNKKLPIWITNLLPVFDINASAVVSYKIEDKKYYLGVLGDIRHSLKKDLNLPEYTAAFEISMHDLLTMTDYRSRYIEPSKYPKVSQDFSFIVDKDIPYSYVIESAQSQLPEIDIISSISPVDIYQPEGEGEYKHVTIRVTIQHREKTLSEKDIKHWMGKVQNAVVKNTKAKVK